jgi:two-component system chemotaxis response regulator CheB
VIVDDSTTVRAVLRRVLSQCPDMQVVAEAADGVEGVAAVVSHRPDLVLMDVQMPKMDGFGAIERIMRHRPTPILVITSQVRRDELHTAFRALQLGALEVFPKPEGLDDWKEMLDRLPAVVRSLAAVDLEETSATDVAVECPAVAATAKKPRLVVIGASAGGPGALREVLLGLGAPAPVGVLIAQHIVGGFEDGLAEWLTRETGVQVRVARGGERLRKHTVVVAPPGAHLRVGDDKVVIVDRRAPARGGHKPSIDTLFESCARQYGGDALAVLLSGMGRDGVEGMLEMRRLGATTFVQDRSSCVVFGMPQAALAAGAAQHSGSPSEIGRALRRLLGGGP